MESMKRILPPNSRESANLFSKLSFWWTISLFKKGAKNALDTSDLFSANKNDSATLLGDNLGRNWGTQTKNGKSSLLRAIGSTFKLELIQLGLLHLSVQMVKAIGIPYFLGQFLMYFREGSDVSYDTAVRNAIGILFLLGYMVIEGNHFQSTAQHLGMRVRVAVTSLIYRKTLRLSRTALTVTNPGKIINLISNDVTRFEYVTLSMNSLWISPLNSVIIIHFLWSQARWASIVGITFLVLIIPTQSYVGKLTMKYRNKISKDSDERIRLMEGIISGCQVIKMYAWEKPFAKLIQAVRKLELKSVRKSTCLRANLLGLLIVTYRFAVFTTVITLVLMKDSITTSNIFSILAFYIALSMQIIRYFYAAFTDVSEMLVVLKRLQKYLEYDEIGIADRKSINYENGKHSNNNNNDHGEKDQSLNQTIQRDVAISITNGIACWNIMNENKPKNEAFSLKNINIDFKKGMLIGIIGTVGSGKSSLLQAILRELPLTTGSIIIDGNLSYASQEPWIFAGSVRQNILFGQRMDQARYDRTVRACALLPDFKQFPQGDNSYVGDKGAALSGGQKARINLARSIYREAEIYLLDDPLSAVDAQVGRFLFNSVVGPKSHLAKMKTTRILVTHQVHFLSEADWIISLKEGTIEFQGTILDLSQSDLNIAQLFNNNESEPDRKSTHGSQQSLNNGNIADETTEETEPQLNVEHSSKNKVDGSLLGNFIKCGVGSFCIFLFVSLFVCTQLCASLIDWWLSYFVSREEIRTSLALTTKHILSEVNLWSSTEYLYVYTGLIIVLIILIVCRAIVLSTTMGNLSQGLHNRMFKGVISSPLRFFDINPSGRILNRFSKDIGNVDELLPNTLVQAIQCTLNIFGIFTVIVVSYPLLAIPIVIMLFVFIWFARITLKSSNNINRLEGITRSPVFSHMASSLTGLSTIRSFKAEKVLIQEFDSHQDAHSGAYFMYIYTSTAFGFSLEMMSFLLISTIIIVTIFLLDTELLQGNKIGLILTQSLIIQEILYISVKQSVVVCNIMMGVERLLEYTNLPTEKQPDIPKEISNNWPTHGKLEFRNVNYRYFYEGDSVLIDLSFLINAGEKIGIVGRTGAGKSSLIGAIFRLAVLDGRILIDDVDTGSILLNHLRTKISIIPQDPVLFSGTLRRNLDPFEEFDDAQLWKVLEEVELKDLILGSGLESTVLTGGSNFSVGQRQLLCMARVLLKNNRIVILDEATANVDPDTDILIQRTIRERFVKCTVLTVAHRLHTIMDSDRVLVMNLGKIVEFATPYELLQKDDGIFKEMIEATGQEESERLKALVHHQYSSQIKES